MYIGNHFAMMEAVIILASIAQRFALIPGRRQTGHSCAARVDSSARRLAGDG